MATADLFGGGTPGFTAAPTQFAVPSRRKTAADFGGGMGLSDLGAGLAQLGRGVGAAQEDAALRASMVQMQELRAGYSLRMRDAEQTGANLREIQAAYEDELATMVESAATPRALAFVRERSADIRLQLTTEASRIDAARTGAKLKADLVRADAAFAKSLQAAPGMLSMLLEERNEIIGTYAGQIPPALLEAVRIEGEQQLAIASAAALIEESPEVALQILQDPASADAPMFDMLAPEARKVLIDDAKRTI